MVKIALRLLFAFRGDRKRQTVPYVFTYYKKRYSEYFGKSKWNNKRDAKSESKNIITWHHNLTFVLVEFNIRGSKKFVLYFRKR